MTEIRRLLTAALSGAALFACGDDDGGEASPGAPGLEVGEPSGPDAADQPEVGTSNSEEPTPDAAAVQVATAEVRWSERADDPSPSCGVRLSLVGPEGEAIVGAEVTAEYESAVDLFRTELCSDVASLVRDGEYEFDGLPPVAQAEIVVRAQGCAPGRYLVGLRAGWTADVGALVLERGCVIRGIVVGPQGPVVEGEVHGQRGERASVAADGRFELRDVAPGSCWLRAIHPRFATDPASPLQLSAGEERELRLHLTSPRELRGVVRDTEGVPVPDAEIAATVTVFESLLARGSRTISYPPTSFETTTGADGTFEFTSVPRGALNLSAVAPSLRGVRRPVAAEQRWAALELPRLPSKVGQLLRAGSGEPVTPERIAVVTAGQRGGPWQAVLGRDLGWPLEQGFFQFRTLGSTWHRVLVESRSTARALSEPFQPGEFGAEPLLVVAPDGPRIEGRVLDEAGLPISAAKVQITEMPGGPDDLMSPWPLPKVYSDHDGRFASSPLVPGSYTVEAEAPFCRRRMLRNVTVDDRGATEEVELRLRRGAAVEGRVWGLVGNRRRSLTLHLRELDSDPDSEVQPLSFMHVLRPTDERFVIPTLDPGRYELSIRGHSGGGRVMLRAGRAFDIHGDGAAEPAGTPSLVFDVQPSELVLRAGEVTRVELIADDHALGCLSGVVRLNGEPAGGVEVVWSNEIARFEWSCLSDPEGRYQFRGLVPGPATLGVFLSGTSREPMRLPVEVSSGPSEHDLEMGYAAVSGRVLDSDGQPLARASVSLAMNDGVRRRMLEVERTDAEGRYSWPRVPVGEVLIEAVASGGVKAQTTIELAPGMEVELADLRVSSESP